MKLPLIEVQEKLVLLPTMVSIIFMCNIYTFILFITILSSSHYPLTINLKIFKDCCSFSAKTSASCVF